MARRGLAENLYEGTPRRDRLDATAFYVVGGLLLMAGLLNQLRLRTSRVRHRLSPAASIRGGRPGQGMAPSYEGSNLSAVNVLSMLAGAAIVVAGILTV